MHEIGETGYITNKTGTVGNTLYSDGRTGVVTGIWHVALRIWLIESEWELYLIWLSELRYIPFSHTTN